MPESAEVRIITDFLDKSLRGKEIDFISQRGSKFEKRPIKGFEDFNKYPSICNYITCKGKFIYGSFVQKETYETYYMFNTLGMTGCWTDRRGMKHDYFRFHLKDGEIVNFIDPRKFGNILFTKDISELKQKLDFLGFDILTNDYIYSTQKNEILRRFRIFNRKNICVALMSQEVLAGVGNYIKAEALYKAKINPWCDVQDFEDKKLLELTAHCINIATESYIHKGCTIHSFTDSQKQKGTYQTQLQVYGKRFDKNGFEIIKEETPDGRNTYWCPIVQFF